MNVQYRIFNIERVRNFYFLIWLSLTIGIREEMFNLLIIKLFDLQVF